MKNYPNTCKKQTGKYMRTPFGPPLELFVIRIARSLYVKIIFRFSAPSALRVYGLYLNLDRDHNGMLSMEELQSYGTGTMTTGECAPFPHQVITQIFQYFWSGYFKNVLHMKAKWITKLILISFWQLKINANQLRYNIYFDFLIFKGRIIWRDLIWIIFSALYNR